jgi:hypothetical protein
MAYDFTLSGERFRLTRQQVVDALRGIEPEPVRTYGVEIGGVVYPVKQALAAACGARRGRFISTAAARVLQRLGFAVSSLPRALPGGTEGAAALATLSRQATEGAPALEVQTLSIPTIILEWSPWTPWSNLEASKSGSAGPHPPGGSPGVYEVRREGEEERLAIGRASDLRMRVRQGLVRGKVPHSAGQAVRRTEDLSRLLVRWSVTHRPGASEEELHRRHVERFGRLPRYTKHT